MADYPSARWAMNCIYFQLATRNPYDRDVAVAEK
jgi:hypothetical protein